MDFTPYWQSEAPPPKVEPKPVLPPAAGEIGTQFTDMDGAGPAGGAAGAGASSGSTINNVIISFSGTLYYCQLNGTIGAAV